MGGPCPAQNKTYYQQVMADFSTTDMTHTLHYLVKLLDTMGQLDQNNPDELMTDQ